jgi:3-hydroxyisobutyrate dehydrogenase
MGMTAKPSIGWIGAGRMGVAMASRLLAAGYEVSVYNRTPGKCEELIRLGAKLARSPADLAACDAVFTMVAGPDSFLAVTLGENGLLSGAAGPACLIDCTTISAEASAQVRQAALDKGTSMLDAPVSGNAKVVQAGRLGFVVSGQREDFERAKPLLEIIGNSATYVGEGEKARIVKICHNVFLGVVAQSLAEIAVLAEKGGVPRHALLDFINNSVMGSMFSRYKSHAYVNLDFTPTFTPVLLLKDLDLGLSAAQDLDTPMPLASHTRDIVQAMISQGYRDCDFAALVEICARAAGLDIKPENVQVDSGL